MMKLTYNNVINASTGYIFFVLNFGLHPYIFYEKVINLFSNSKLANYLASKQKEPIVVY